MPDGMTNIYHCRICHQDHNFNGPMGSGCGGTETNCYPSCDKENLRVALAASKKREEELAGRLNKGETIRSLFDFLKDGEEKYVEELQDTLQAKDAEIAGLKAVYEEVNKLMLLLVSMKEKGEQGHIDFEPLFNVYKAFKESPLEEHDRGVRNEERT